jgi:hypothetical protein
MESPNSSLSKHALQRLFEESDDEDSYISSPYSSVETSPNWGRTMDSDDEEIAGMFDLGLDLPDISDLFPSSDSEDYDIKNNDTVYDVKGPFSRM